MQLTQIHVYPVKSLGGVRLQQAELYRSGLKYDRQWMVVNEANQFLTQRSHPEMALIHTHIVNGQLVLSSLGMEDHSVPDADPDAQKISTRVFSDPVSAIELDALTHEWLSDALGFSCKLVCFPDDEFRQCDQDIAQAGDHTRFADAYPLLVVSQSSLDDLNSRLTHPVGMDRFRPNLVIDGCTAFAEDEWTSITINETAIRMLEPCSRCSVPTVDPKTGILAGPEPIHTLSSYRQRDGEVYFGSNYTAEMASGLASTIAIGDPVFATANDFSHR